MHTNVKVVMFNAAVTIFFFCNVREEKFDRQDLKTKLCIFRVYPLYLILFPSVNSLPCRTGHMVYTHACGRVEAC